MDALIDPRWLTSIMWLAIIVVSATLMAIAAWFASDRHAKIASEEIEGAAIQDHIKESIRQRDNLKVIK